MDLSAALEEAAQLSDQLHSDAPAAGSNKVKLPSEEAERATQSYSHRRWASGAPKEQQHSLAYATAYAYAEADMEGEEESVAGVRRQQADVHRSRSDRKRQHGAGQHLGIDQGADYASGLGAESSVASVQRRAFHDNAVRLNESQYAGSAIHSNIGYDRVVAGSDVSADRGFDPHRQNPYMGYDNRPLHRREVEALRSSYGTQQRGLGRNASSGRFDEQGVDEINMFDEHDDESEVHRRQTTRGRDETSTVGKASLASSAWLNDRTLTFTKDQENSGPREAAGHDAGSAVTGATAATSASARWRRRPDMRGVPQQSSSPRGSPRNPPRNRDAGSEEEEEVSGSFRFSVDSSQQGGRPRRERSRDRRRRGDRIDEEGSDHSDYDDRTRGRNRRQGSRSRSPRLPRTPRSPRRVAQDEDHYTDGRYGDDDIQPHKSLRSTTGGDGSSQSGESPQNDPIIRTSGTSTASPSAVGTNERKKKTLRRSGESIGHSKEGSVPSRVPTPEVKEIPHEAVVQQQMQADQDVVDAQKAAMEQQQLEQQKMELVDDSHMIIGPLGIPDPNVMRKRLPSSAFSHEEDRPEVMTLDYTPAINRRPIDLDTPLRCMRMGRPVKIMMVVTMYNEEPDELERSLRGVAVNLDQLAPGVTWEEIVVVIVCDGREKMNKACLEYMEKELKIWDSNMLLKKHRNNDVTCHIFEKTVELPRHSAQRVYYQPLQVVLAVKEKNGGKLNSHLWFFSGFCTQVQPTYTFLLDVGTEPRVNALASLYDAMQQNPQIGGVCGEITVRNPKIYNPVEASQHFEYKVSHFMDKAMESVFGYISVLPGAFSAYRWEAVRGEPLNQYFFVEERSVKQLGPFLANMYLAEDRVLCFELLAKRNRTWTLHYVAGAVAETDIPGSLTDLIKQRRRWLNGSFFALLYFIGHFSKLLAKSNHSVGRRAALCIQFVYQFFLMVLSWFAVGSLYLSLLVIFLMAFEDVNTSELSDVGNHVLWAFSLLYFYLTIMQLLTGLGSRPHAVQRIYFVSSLVYGVLMLTAIGTSFWHLARGVFSTYVVAASVGAFGAYFTSAFLHGQMITVMTVFIQYMFMLPTFVNMFTIYSFCNMHDISWGTKEGNLRNQRIEIKRKENPAAAAAAAKAAKKAAGAMGGGEFFEGTQDATTKATELMLHELRMKAEERAIEREMGRRRAKLAAEQADMARDFAAFRTRLLALYIATNWVYVSLVVHLDWLGLYAEFIAAAIFFTLTYKLLGSIWYQVEKVVKWIWRRYCGWCCFECCWDHTTNMGLVDGDDYDESDIVAVPMPMGMQDPNMQVAPQQQVTAQQQMQTAGSGKRSKSKAKGKDKRREKKSKKPKKKSRKDRSKEGGKDRRRRNKKRSGEDDSEDDEAAYRRTQAADSLEDELNSSDSDDSAAGWGRGGRVRQRMQQMQKRMSTGQPVPMIPMPMQQQMMHAGAYNQGYGQGFEHYPDQQLGPDQVFSAEATGSVPMAQYEQQQQAGMGSSHGHGDEEDIEMIDLSTTIHGAQHASNNVISHTQAYPGQQGIGSPEGSPVHDAGTGGYGSPRAQGDTGTVLSGHTSMIDLADELNGAHAVSSNVITNTAALAKQSSRRGVERV